jgi:lipoyl(octanoyl) transferase
MTACRILIDPEPAPGVWNMAVDELLLESAIESGVCSVRVYRWAEPTVSLGHFQNAAAITGELAALPLVRRLSGGGAILHHHELTYSCAVPSGHAAIRNPTDLYETAHAAIIRVLAGIGIAAQMRGDTQAGDESAFLCFSRGDPRDVVLHGHKIVGSAQRRRRGAVLQHGSVLLKASEFAPDYPGLLDLAGELESSSQLLESIVNVLAGELAESQGVEELTPIERQRVAKLEIAAKQLVHATHSIRL